MEGASTLEGAARPGTRIANGEEEQKQVCVKAYYLPRLQSTALSRDAPLRHE